MEINWYGLSCYRLSERGAATIITDPFDQKTGLPQPKLKGKVVTMSNGSNGSGDLKHINGQEHYLDSPGEYEIGGVFINGIATPRKSRDEKRNTIFVFNYSGVTVAHVGELYKVPAQTQIEELETVNVLIVPVGGNGVLNASQASELVSMFEPNFVIPMLYEQPGLKRSLEPLEKFLKEMGVSEFNEESTLKITSSSLPEETQVVVLESKSA
ncbi:MAG: MBL fold metallo-hydrolase [Chloroflexota bacterium]